jgi:hypothetical protein
VEPVSIEPKVDPPNWMDPETNISLPAPSRTGLRIIRYFIRGGVAGNKTPTLREFESVWMSELGKQQYKAELKDLKEKGWIGIGRFRSEEHIGLLNRDYSVKYYAHCSSIGIVPPIQHHAQAHTNGGLYRVT